MEMPVAKILSTNRPIVERGGCLKKSAKKTQLFSKDLIEVA
jgi:hypothetical protein